MDWSKFPIEKLTHYVAGIIPGFCVLVLVEFAHPGIGARFFGIGFLGYRTKVAVALAFAFLVGNTLTALLTLILGVLFGVMVGMEMRSAHRSSGVQDWQPTPWQDPRWRALAGRYLGADAPEDTRLEPRPGFDMRRKFQEGLPPKISSVSVEDMDRERSRLEVNDAKWAAWYQHFHEVILRSEQRTFDSYVRTGFTFNLAAAALTVLVGAVFLRAARHWWLVAAAFVWLIYLGLELAGNYRSYKNQSSTLASQIRYLSNLVGSHPNCPSE